MWINRGGYLPSDVSLPSDVAFDPRPESPESSSIVVFLNANRSKLMQMCMEEDQIDLNTFDTIFKSLMEGDTITALNASVRTTVLLLDIIQSNNINI